MGSSSFYKRIKEAIAGISFNVFLWAVEMTRDEYWLAIYKDEQMRINREN